MKNVDINLGRACNNRCVFCSNGAVTAKERGWMRIEEIEREMDDRKREGYLSIGFLGGEPTLYPNLPRLIRQARERGFERIVIITNGCRLDDPEFLDHLIEEGLTRVAFSIHSHRAATEDAITQRKGSFRRKVAALRLLAEAAREGLLPDGLSVNAVLHKKLLPHLETFVRHFQKLGVDDIRFNFIRPEHQAVGKKTWVPAFAETTPRVRDLVLRNQAELGMHLTFADFPLCRLPWEILANPALRQAYVGENLDLTTEVTLYKPDEVGGPQRFNWKTQRQTYLKALLPVCAACPLQAHCEGVWQGYLDIYGPDEFANGPSLARACAASF